MPLELQTKAQQIATFEKMAAQITTLRKDGSEARLMFHFSPAEKLIGPLNPGNFLTTTPILSSKDAINQLALDKPIDTKLFVHSFIVTRGQFVAAPNSIPGTRLVAPANGRIGFGTEYINTVPLYPIGVSFPAD